MHRVKIFTLVKQKLKTVGSFDPNKQKVKGKSTDLISVQMSLKFSSFIISDG